MSLAVHLFDAWKTAYEQNNAEVFDYHSPRALGEQLTTQHDRATAEQAVAEVRKMIRGTCNFEMHLLLAYAQSYVRRSRLGVKREKNIGTAEIYIARAKRLAQTLKTWGYVSDKSDARHLLDQHTLAEAEFELPRLEQQLANLTAASAIATRFEKT